MAEADGGWLTPSQPVRPGPVVGGMVYALPLKNWRARSDAHSSGRPPVPDGGGGQDCEVFQGTGEGVRESRIKRVKNVLGWTSRSSYKRTNKPLRQK